MIWVCDDSTGLLSISGVELVGGDPRWCAYDLSVLWSDETYRGNNVVKPFAAGRLPFTHRQDDTRYLLPLGVRGTVDTNGVGVARDDQQGELAAAIAELQDSICGPPDVDDGTGTRPAIYDRPDGVTLYADVQVLAPRKRRSVRGLWVGDLELILTRPWEVAS